VHEAADIKRIYDVVRNWRTVHCVTCFCIKFRAITAFFFVYMDLYGCGVLFGCLCARAAQTNLSSREVTWCCAQEVEVFPPVPETGDSKWLPAQSDAVVVVFASEEVAGTVGVGFQRFSFISIWPQQRFPHESSASLIQRGVPRVFCCQLPIASTSAPD
jgi:hypothetical protein